MNEILRAYRQKFPAYNNVPDDELIVAVGEKYPAYLQDESFRADYLRASAAADAPGVLSTFGREAAAGVVPSGGAAAGALLGAEIGSAGGPIGTLAGGIIGGLAGYMGAEKAQSAVLDEAAPDFQEARRKGAEANPWAATWGGVASAAPSFVFNPGSSVGAMSKVLRGAATKAEALTAAAPIALGAGTAAAVPLILEGRAPTVQEIVGGTAQAVLFGEPRFGAKARAASARVVPRETIEAGRKALDEVLPADESSVSKSPEVATGKPRSAELTEAADFLASMDYEDPRVIQLARDNFRLTDDEMAAVQGELGVAIARRKALALDSADRKARQDSAWDQAQKSLPPEARGGTATDYVRPNYEAEASRVSPDEMYGGREVFGPPRGPEEIILSRSRPVSVEGEVIPKNKGPFAQTDETAIPIIERTTKTKTSKKPSEPAPASVVEPKPAEASVAPPIAEAAEPMRATPKAKTEPARNPMAMADAEAKSAPAAALSVPEDATAFKLRSDPADFKPHMPIQAKNKFGAKQETLSEMASRYVREGGQKPEDFIFGRIGAKGDFVPLAEQPLTGIAKTKAQIAEANARVKKAVEKAQKLGAVADPKAMAENTIEFYHALFDSAALHIKLGVQTAAEWAKQAGLTLTKALERVWADAQTGKRNPPELPAKLPESIGKGDKTDTRAMAEKADALNLPEHSKLAVLRHADYDVVSDKRVSDDVRTLTDADLLGVTPEDHFYSAAQVERAARLERDGREAEADAVLTELEKQSTASGQNISYLRTLYLRSPRLYARKINQHLTTNGYDPLTPKKLDIIKKGVNKSSAAEDALAKATDAWKADPKSLDKLNAMEAARVESGKASAELLVNTQKMMPRSAWTTLKSILQGNLLAPISTVANVFGNVSFTPWRNAGRGVATLIDMVDAGIRAKKAGKEPWAFRQVTVSPGKSKIGATIGDSLKEAGQIMLRGADNTKGEPGHALHPFDAWASMTVQKEMLPTADGKLTAGAKADIWLQRTFGMAAEPMLRTLGAGDIPFRDASMRAAVVNESALRIVNGQRVPLTEAEIKIATKQPELFFDRNTAKRIRDEALSRIFQRQSPTIRMINSWMVRQGPFMDFMYATVAPYKLTPWNIVGEILSYNPFVALGKTGYEVAKMKSIAAKATASERAGNTSQSRQQTALAENARREAKLSAGKAVVGTIMSGAAWYLYEKGIMSPSYDSSDENIKQRIQAGEILPPNHINLTALKRVLDGGSAAPQKGDTTMDVFRAGGLAGAFLYVMANIGRDIEKQRDAGSDALAKAILVDSTWEAARFGINQSFLKGVTGILEGIRDGRGDQAIQNYINAAISIPLPNTLSSISRAQREYKPDTKPEKWSDYFTKAVQNRLGGVTGIDAYMPLKLDVWGRPMRETPEGRNAYVYHMADVFKFQQASDSPLDMAVYKLARETSDARAIPPIPQPDFTFGGKTYELTREQYNRLASTVGQQRREMVEMLVTGPTFHTLPNEMKLRMLDRYYDVGERRGRAKFLQQTPLSTLKPRGRRAGFSYE